MDRHEFLFRARQEWSKRWDSVLAAAGRDFAQQTRVAANRGRFFFAPAEVDNLLRLIRERLPREAENIVERANRICSHRFDLLGYEAVDYGPEINWHADAVHNKIAPKKPFYRIRYLDFGEVGDSKITWELNRHQHLVTLAKAYRLSGEERFAREIVDQWRSWHSQNTYPLGINWASSLEVAFRSLSWIWARALLEDTKIFDADFQNEYLRAQALNGRHIERYLSTYFSPNTHLLGEGVALFFLGVLCPELAAAKRWRALGWQIVLSESEKQVNADGMHFEQSVYYHVYALDFFVHAALLALANGMELPKNLEQTIERMMNVVFLLGRAGPLPRFGDDDGGRLFDPARNRGEHLLDPLAAGAILFQRGDYKSVARELREETIWLLGEQGIRQWDNLELQPVKLNSAALPDSGIYVLTAPSSQEQLIVKSGPSVPQTRGHAHADVLSLCFQAFGKELLIDPGAFEYIGHGRKRDLYRGTAMHNTLTIDGLDQAEPGGPFSWKTELRARTDHWIAGESFDLLVGSHAGYTRLENPVIHQRWIIAMRAGVFLVRDLVEGEGEHRLEISWRLSPELHMQQKDDYRIRQSSRGIAIITSDKHGWSEEVHKGPWSPAYGSQRMTTVLKYAVQSAMPAEFATIFAPLGDVADVPGKLTSLRIAGRSVSGYRYERGDASYEFYFAKTSRLNTGGPEPSERWVCGSISSDANFAAIMKTAAKEPEVIFCGGSFLDLDGNRVLSTKKRVARCELIGGETAQVFCSDPEAVATPEQAAK